MSDEGQPAGRASAPGVLRLVQDFVNTNDLEDGRDRLGESELLRTWLVERGLISAHEAVGPPEVKRVIRVREAIRSLAMSNNGWNLDPAAIETLNAAAAATAGRVRFDSHGRAFFASQSRGVDGALFTILSAVYQSMVEGTWSRLKACRRDVCRWVFFDQSRNRSGAWCAMAICGNRIKTGAYYRRKKAATAGRRRPP
jgi:predicted RNA-binding Zn ribbon-like protein